MEGGGGMPFRAELAYTLRDLRQFDRVHQKHRHRTVYMVTWVVLIIGIVMVLGAGAVLLALGAFDRETQILYLAVSVLLAICVLSRELRVRASLKSLMAQGTLTLTADEDGVHTAARSVSSTFGYDSFCDLVHSGETYYLCLDRRKTLILPARCFTEGDPRAFGAFMEQKTGLTVKEIQ